MPQLGFEWLRPNEIRGQAGLRRAAGNLEVERSRVLAVTLAIGK